MVALGSYRVCIGITGTATAACDSNTVTGLSCHSNDEFADSHGAMQAHAFRMWRTAVRMLQTLSPRLEHAAHWCQPSIFERITLT